MSAASVLNDARKGEIQDAYRAWLNAHGFFPRRGQREMIAQVARAFCGEPPRIAAVEAGTGTGKTAAYCLAAIPLAKTLRKRVVISTATIALQEQIVQRDLPDLKAHAGIEFSFALAKGRRRYVCLKRLEERLRHDQKEMPLALAPTPDEAETCQRMLGEFEAGAWLGDFDSWHDTPPERTWAAVTTDHRACAKSRCSFFQACPYFAARRALDDADVVVANHDLVLADLALGGGAVLPPPQEAIFVLDEAHHLAERTQRHFTAHARLRGAMQWLEQLNEAVGTCAQRFARPPELVSMAERLASQTAAAAQLLREADGVARQLDIEAKEGRDTFRFPLGRVEAAIAEPCKALAGYFADIGKQLGRLRGQLEAVMGGELLWKHAERAEDWLGVAGQLLDRAEANAALFRDYAEAGGDEAGRAARWVRCVALDAGDDLEFFSAPLDPGRILDEALWQRCHAALCTSATLRAPGGFGRFLEAAGLPQETRQTFIASPFDFERLASLDVPAMCSDPRNPAEHTREVAALLPNLLEAEPSALALFASWQQLRGVVDALPAAVLKRCRIQGDHSKQALLEAHRAAVDAGEPSYILGLASFAEGIDLPNDHCRHVIIARLPFAPPSDPVEEATAEWMASQGRNPFMELSVPDAALRLAQACGRLIRHEEDRGRITLLDRRIVTMRYGRALLDALPPYRLNVSAGDD